MALVSLSGPFFNEKFRQDINDVVNRQLIAVSEKTKKWLKDVVPEILQQVDNDHVGPLVPKTPAEKSKRRCRKLKTTPSVDLNLLQPQSVRTNTRYLTRAQSRIQTTIPADESSIIDTSKLEESGVALTTVKKGRKRGRKSKAETTLIDSIGSSSKFKTPETVVNAAIPVDHDETPIASASIANRSSSEGHSPKTLKKACLPDLLVKRSKSNENSNKKLVTPETVKKIACSTVTVKKTPTNVAEIQSAALQNTFTITETLRKARRLEQKSSLEENSTALSDKDSCSKLISQANVKNVNDCSAVKSDTVAENAGSSKIEEDLDVSSKSSDRKHLGINPLSKQIDKTARLSIKRSSIATKQLYSKKSAFFRTLVPPSTSKPESITYNLINRKTPAKSNIAQTVQKAPLFESLLSKSQTRIPSNLAGPNVTSFIKKRTPHKEQKEHENHIAEKLKHQEIKQAGATVKKDELLKAKAEEAKRIREEKEQKAAASREAKKALEDEKKRKIEDKHQAAAARREAQRLAEVEARKKFEEERERLKNEREEKERLSSERRLKALEQVEVVPKSSSKIMANTKSMYGASLKYVTTYVPDLNKLSNDKPTETYDMTPTDQKGRKVLTKPQSKQAPSQNDYGINDLHSGDETDEPESPKKPIPSWAEGAPFKATLVSQYYSNLDVRELFGKMAQPDLSKIFLNNRRRFHHRTSSANWNNVSWMPFIDDVDGGDRLTEDA